MKPNSISRETKTFYENSIPYIMTKDDSIDIDNKEDLDLAELYLKR